MEGRGYAARLKGSGRCWSPIQSCGPLTTACMWQSPWQLTNTLLRLAISIVGLARTGIGVHPGACGIPTVAAVIRENRMLLLRSIMQTSRAHGMVSVDDHLMELVEQGAIAPEAAVARAENRERFEGLVDPVRADH